MPEPTDSPHTPATTAPTGVSSAAPDATCSYYRDADGHLWRDLKASELPTALRQCVESRRDGHPANDQLWVDIDSEDRTQHALLANVFHFHPLAIEDTLSGDSRVRVEQYEGYLFAIVRGVAFQEETPDPYDLATQNVYLFLGPNYLVTVHAGPAPSVGGVRGMIEHNPGLMGHGVARLAHLVMDAAIDAYFPVLDGIDGFFDEIEPRVFTAFDEKALQDIFQLKRLVLLLRRYLAPQREVFNVLANRPSDLLTPEEQRYFADVHDHVMRIYDGIDSARELLSSTLDSYLTQVSNRTGQASKGLAVVATLSVPFVVVAGMWGMNFQRVPFADYKYGFEYMVVFQLAIGVALVVLLRWRKLI